MTLSNYIEKEFSWWSSSMRKKLHERVKNVVREIEMEEYGDELVTLKVYNQRRNEDEKSN